MPFNRFRSADGRNVDTVLGPEMRSTGEVMGFDADFGAAFAKSQSAAFGGLPRRGPGLRLGGQPRQAAHDLPDQAAGRPRVRDPRDRRHGRGAAPQRRTGDRGAQALGRPRPDGELTTVRADPRRRGRPRHQHPARRDLGRVAAAGRLRDPDRVRRRANIPCITTVQGLGAAVQGIEALRAGNLGVRSLQELERDPSPTRKERSDPDRHATVAPSAERGPLQVRGEVFSIKRVGDYQHLTIVADGIAERTRPGNFVALAVGGPDVRRRCCGARSRSTGSGRRGSTAAPSRSCSPRTAPGTRWMERLQPHDPIDVVGPLGRPVQAAEGAGGVRARRRRLRIGTAVRARRAAPRAQVRGRTWCSAPRPRRGSSVRWRRSGRRSPSPSRRVDGSVGIKGLVTDALPRLISRNRIEVVYSCGPMGMLKAVTDVATEHGAWSQTAVEESMACGIGVCMTCVLPVRGDDGVDPDDPLLRRGAGLRR